MRITIITLLLACAASPASADLLLYEGFDYTITGSPTLLGGQTHPSGNQWLKPSAPTAEYTEVWAGSVGYEGLPAPTGNSARVKRATPSSGELRLSIPGQPYDRVNGGSYFFSFTMKLESFVNFAVGTGDAGAKTADARRGGFVGGFFGAPASTSTGMTLGKSFAAPVYIRRELDYEALGTDGTPGAQTGRYEIGVQKRAEASGIFDGTNSRGVVYDESVSYGVGETLLIVGEYKFVDTAIDGVADIARLWVNPTPGDLTAEANPTVVDDSAASLNLAGALPIASFHWRNDTNVPGNMFMDELRIGTTFADVLPTAPAGLPGDFNGDLVVDGNDFLLWQRGGTSPPLSPAALQEWKDHFGQVASSSLVNGVPEPASAVLAALAGAGVLSMVRRRR